jgi:hypothetical protein
MAPPQKYEISPQELLAIYNKCGRNTAETCRITGIKQRSTVYERLKNAGLWPGTPNKYANKSAKTAAPTKPQNKITVKNDDKSANIDYYGTEITTAEELIAKSGIDMNIYEIDRVTVNQWESPGSNSDGAYKTALYQIKVTLRRKEDTQVVVERLLADLAAAAPVVKKIKYPRAKEQKGRKALEISIMDPHYGMQCYKGESDHSWSMEECEKLCMWSIDALLERAKQYGSFEEIVMPFGNDFMHHDNLQHTTTKGTFQSEGISYSVALQNAVRLALTMVNRLAEVAPVRVVVVPGNHDYLSVNAIGMVLDAYFRNDENVTVDCGISPYKFYRFGTNLIGFDHGHNINVIRLAAIMAHERKQDWAETSFREWHLGDQHRKGSSKPTTMEEQGVSIEYLPALTPPNAWHRLKGFNWQQRGAMAFVYDYNEGPVARLQVNLNSYTGKPTGE